MPATPRLLRRVSPWDALGLLCVLALGAGLLGLRARTARVEAAEAQALAPGADIRAGDEWIGLYFQDRKIGLTRITKTPRSDGGWDFEVESTVKLESLGVPARAELQLTAHLDAARTLSGFELALRAGPQAFRAEGRVEGPERRELRLAVSTAGSRTERVVTLPAPPVLRDLMGPSLAAGAGAPGSRFTVPGFDPWTLSATPVEVETVGPDTLVLMAQEVPATRVRQRVDGLVLDAWVNERGEMLRQELPLGLVAIRQTEEEARWGMAGDEGVSLADTVEIPVPALPRAPEALETLVVDLDGVEPAALGLSPADLDRPPAQRLAGRRLTVTRPVPPAGLPLSAVPPAVGELRDALAADPAIQADHPRIRATARAILDEAGARDTLSAARALMAWLRARMRFERRGGFPSALETLDALAGDCTETSALFAALARSAGVPTRVVFGLVYKAEPRPRFAWHAWNEVAVTDGWVFVDATWGQIPADVGHLALVSGGFSRQAELLRVMGRLRLNIVETR